ncbi:hypothetical protein [Streptomyces sp. AN091965]|uniref:hypothetical protein n=1 Tax=Streptomyces sp. AN091965 TaxID=2927803 RepID=UPI001F609765|nr:hypothetical protein [Streptomyces sp. AN091965]MCI3929974.1 hypothetical protein [Streptomyces sp. AN091965]
MRDMPPRAVFVTVQVKPEQREQARFALQAQGIASEFSYRRDTEVEAWFQPPSEEWPPAIDFVWNCYSKVTDALADTPFIAIEPGGLEGSDLTSWAAFDQQTGRGLGFVIDPTCVRAVQLLDLAELLEHQGLTNSDITWRAVGDPEGLGE